ncbi:MAG: NAD(P)/FAD-dependent oxidoreductase [Eggerthellaceae bacterium]|nr:NAD(P)/FAD-dependent oxidoreductase [Eggerthellaceae bacterium]
MTKYDVVVAGAGINGLSAAAYLAKGGLKVCVLEGRDIIGGGLVSYKDPYGCIHDGASTVHSLIQLNPLLRNDELGLKAKYGLKYVMPEAVTTNHFVDRDLALTIWMDLDKTCDEIAEKLGQEEADAYREFIGFINAVGPMLTMGMFAPPVDAEMMVGALMGLGEMGQRLIRYFGMSAWDIAMETFKTYELRECTTRFVSETMVSPFEPGTGAGYLAVMYMFHMDGCRFPWCVGGSRGLTDCLAQLIEDCGGIVRTNAFIKGVKVEDGTAKAFVLADGEEVEGDKLISTLHVKQMFGSTGFLGADVMGEEFTAKVDGLIPSSYVGFLQNITFKKKPIYKLTNDETHACITEQSHGLEEYQTMFDEMAKGNPSPYGSSATCTQTIYDETRRGENGEYTTLYLYNYEPYALYGDPANWDKYGQEIADKNLAAWCELTTNITPEDVLYRHVSNPLDYERTFPSWLCGDFCHISQCASQGSSNRPFPAIARYATPIKNLYQAGASAWPGPTVTGGGRAVAQVIFQDMDIDFDAVING